MYQSGRGIPQDTIRALRLFLLSAENGNMKAALNLANVFRAGIGVKQDPTPSYMWLQIAAAGGEDVAEALHVASQEIDEPRLKLAQQQAAAWWARHNHDATPESVASSRSVDFPSR